MDDGRNDFDFWMGSWKVRNRCLRERLAASDEWVEFDATVTARPLAGVLGNEDEFRTDHDGGFVGMSFRFFDPETKTWSIYWADSRRPGKLDPPVYGSFAGERGSFQGADTLGEEADPHALRLVRRDDADAALGAVVLGRRRQDLGGELGDGLRQGLGERTSRGGALRAGFTNPDVCVPARRVLRAAEGGHMYIGVGTLVIILIIIILILIF